MTKDERPDTQYSINQLREKYLEVHTLEDQEVARLSNNTDKLILILRPMGLDPRDYPVFLSKRQTLLNLARHILRELDPTPEDKILETLKRIEQILEQQDASH